MKAAAAHSRKLPRFDTLREAELALFAARDEALRALETTTTGWAFRPDYTPESLKLLELEFLRLHELGYVGAPLSKDVLERATAMYFGELLVRRAGFAWVVEEFAFESGAYELGVTRGHLTVMLSSFDDLPTRPNNKRRQSMWRAYNQYAG